MLSVNRSKINKNAPPKQNNTILYHQSWRLILKCSKSSRFLTTDEEVRNMGDVGRVRVGIIGASGYGGVQLVRLLATTHK